MNESLVEFHEADLPFDRQRGEGVFLDDRAGENFRPLNRVDHHKGSRGSSPERAKQKTKARIRPEFADAR
jgi:hypothetical protein